MIVMLSVLAVILLGWAGLWMVTWTKPNADISGSMGLYVRRWHLYWDEQKLLIMVHRFFGADKDPPHNHSGSSLSIVLGGRGTEIYYDKEGKEIKRRVRRAGQLVFRTDKDIHHVHSSEAHPLTTLFIAFPKGTPWGMWTEKGFVEAKVFCKGMSDKRFVWVKKPKTNSKKKVA